MASTEFGFMVRQYRGRISPVSVGLPSVGHRRVAGLRREELALLADVSVDYVTRLEQGRATKPSEQVVEALGRALRLSSVEREHLFRAAGLVAPGQGTVPAHITPSIWRMLDRLTATPVAVGDAAWTLLLANPMYTALMGEHHGKERNAVWRTFLGSGTRIRYTAQSRRDLEVTQVTELRTTAHRYPNDHRVRCLVDELRSNSSRFAELWDSGCTDRHFESRKTIDHPDVGAVTLDCDVLTVAASHLRVLIYTAEPGSPDSENLKLLGAIGTQALTSST